MSSAIFDNKYIGKKVRFKTAGTKERFGEIMAIGMDSNGRFYFLLNEDKIRFDAMPANECTLVDS